MPSAQRKPAARLVRRQPRGRPTVVESQTPPPKPKRADVTPEPEPRSESKPDSRRRSPRSGKRTPPSESHREPAHPMAGGDASTPRKAPSAGPSLVHEEGNLSRKHEMEGPMKKASNRSWDKVYVVVHGPSLSCYKDQKHAKQDPSSRIHHEGAFDLNGAECEYARDYIKRPNVFRLRLANGGEYLFMAKDQAEMDHWIRTINSTAPKGEGAGPSRSQTMPARTEEPKDSAKKKGFLTFKKK